VGVAGAAAEGSNLNSPCLMSYPQEVLTKPRLEKPYPGFGWADSDWTCQPPSFAVRGRAPCVRRFCVRPAASGHVNSRDDQHGQHNQRSCSATMSRPAEPAGWFARWSVKARRRSNAARRTQPRWHRGDYSMTLGALIVLAVLVVAGIYVPRSSWTHAKSPDAGSPAAAPQSSVADTSNQSPPSQSPDTASPSAASSAPPADTTSGMANSDSTPPARRPGDSHRFRGQLECDATTDAAGGCGYGKIKFDSSRQEIHVPEQRYARAKQPDPRKVMREPLRQVAPAAPLSWTELEKTVDQLSNRAAAVNSSLGSSPTATGCKRLRPARRHGGEAGKPEIKLVQGGTGASTQDMARAKKYADLAEGDANVLERFLGH